jgi:hypothetical protein
MLLLVMFGMLDLLPTPGLLRPGPVLLMDMLLPTMATVTLPHKVTVLDTDMPPLLMDTILHSTDTEKNKQSETNPKNLIVILSCVH